MYQAINLGKKPITALVRATFATVKRGFMNIFIRQIRQRDRQRTDYIHKEK